MHPPTATIPPECIRCRADISSAARRRSAAGRSGREIVRLQPIGQLADWVPGALPPISDKYLLPPSVFPPRAAFGRGGTGSPEKLTTYRVSSANGTVSSLAKGYLPVLLRKPDIL